MKESKFKSLFGQRLMIALSFAILLGVFLTIYYFYFAPQERNHFNQSAFRELAHISDNIQTRINNYAEAIGNKEYPEVYKKHRELDVLDRAPCNSKGLSYERAREIISTDHTLALKRKEAPNLNDDEEKNYNAIDTLFAQGGDIRASLSGVRRPQEILADIVSIHAGFFEQIIVVQANDSLFKGNTVTKSGEKTVIPTAQSRILYSAGSLAIDPYFPRDSLLRSKDIFLLPTVHDIHMQGANYKLFLHPFRVKGDLYFTGGILSEQEYKTRSHNFPLSYFMVAAVLLILVLMSLPFLKVFLIGAQENISINDFRTIIAMLFILPFIVLLFLAAFYIEHMRDRDTELKLKSLHKDIGEKFSNEIRQSLIQLKEYDSLFQKTGPVNLGDTPVCSLYQQGSVPVANFIYHPRHYKNLDGVFWANHTGQMTARWGFMKKWSPLVSVSERKYFTDIISNSSYQLPGSPSFRFSILPIISKTSGEYSVNISTNSTAAPGPLVIVLYGKMYSIYRPVLPHGFEFCIIDDTGLVIGHSDSRRNRQENILDESEDAEVIQQIIANRDSLPPSRMQLYGHETETVISPMLDLPFFLITYYDRRNQHLFTWHILTFTFFTQSMVLFVVGLFLLYFYYANRRTSKLFFIPETLNWIKPDYSKSDYYSMNIRYQLTVLGFVLVGIIVHWEGVTQYLLDISIFLPLFLILGYYLIRAAALTNESIDRGSFYTLSEVYTKYGVNLLKLLVPYLIIVLFYSILRSELDNATEKDNRDSFYFTLMQILVPLVAILMSWRWFESLIVDIKRKPVDIQPDPVAGDDDKTNHPEEKKEKYLDKLILTLILSVTMTSILPTIGLLLYSSIQEISLQTKSNQIFIAKNILRHAGEVNEKVERSKFLTHPLFYEEDRRYIDSLKYSQGFGLYLDSSTIQVKDTLEDMPEKVKFYNFGFYRKVTNYLFLPADHLDFFNYNEEYYWKRDTLKADKDSLRLFYGTLSNNRVIKNIILCSPIPHFIPFRSVLTKTEIVLLFVGFVAIFAAFINLVRSLTKRIFLVGYFNIPDKVKDPNFIDGLFSNIYLSGISRDFWNSHIVTIGAVIKKEKEYSPASKEYDDRILAIQTTLAKHYEKVWNACSHAEQSVLYDFALDGFTNYRNIHILYHLYHKGIIEKRDAQLTIVSDSLRNYILSKVGSAEINAIRSEISEGGKWGNLRVILYVLLFAIFLFLFIVQEDVSKRVIAIITSLTAIVPFLIRLFDAAGSKQGAPAKSTS